MEVVPTQKSFKEYMYFWIGQLFSLLGSNVVYFVIILWVELSTHNPIMLSLAAFFFAFPVVICVPFAGVLSDKWKRKEIILVVDSLQAFATFLLIILFLLNLASIWVIFIFISIRSVFQAFHQPTVSAVIPTMVPKEKLSKINAINFLFMGLIQIIGPALGAFLLLFFTIREVLWLDIITFGIALIPLLLVKIPLVRRTEDSNEKSSFVKDFRVGFKALRAVQGLVILMILSMFVNFLAQPVGVLLPHFVVDIHGGLEFEYAFVSIFFQAGIILGAVYTFVRKKWDHTVRNIFLTIALAGIGIIILSFVPLGNFLIMGIIMFATGINMPIINTMYSTYLQTSVPHDKLGRVTSIDLTFSLIINPIGTIIVGPLAVLMGTSNLFFISGLLMFGVTLSLYTFKSVRLADIKDHVSLSVPEFIE